MSITLFKIGVILCISATIWISIIFFEADKISEEFILEPASSHIIKLNFVGKDIGFYKIFMSEFNGEEMYIQILDNNRNIIAEQSVQTKMSVGYFDYEKSGNYFIRIANISENSANIQVELGDTNSQNMIPAGLVVFVGALILIISSYMKLKNYKIAQPDENIS